MKLPTTTFSGATPKSILKSRKSEESLSPLSDPSEVVAVTSKRPQSASILKRKVSREEIRRTLSPSSDE